MCTRFCIERKPTRVIYILISKTSDIGVRRKFMLVLFIEYSTESEEVRGSHQYCIFQKGKYSLKEEILAAIVFCEYSSS